MGQDRFDHMRVLGDAQLVGDSQKQCVGFGNGFVRSELLDEHIRFGRVAAAEDRAGPRVNEADLVLFSTLVSEIGTIAIIDQGDDAAADPRFPRVAGLFPGGAVDPDLGGLLNV